MSNFVFVLDTNKRPLTPCKPSVARKLLNAGKAAVYRRYPFTIIMKKKSIDATPVPIQLKIDPGSKTTGIALVDSQNQVIFGMELEHRGQQIKDVHTSRRAVRRNRRNRKTRYRKVRFLNRFPKKCWLPPSLMHRVLTTETWVNRLIKFAPIGSIAQELVRFNTQKLDNPEISGIEYQQGTLAGYEVREYLLTKWDRKCAYCGAAYVPLQIEHIQARSKGGSNRVSNLSLACERCNLRKGNRDIKDFLKCKPDVLSRVLRQAKLPLKDASAVNTTRWKLFETLKSFGLPISTGSGGLTKFNRTRLDLPKTHWLDAACVGTVENLIVLTSRILKVKATGMGGRQRCQTDKYGYPQKHRPLRPILGFCTGDIVRADVPKGKYQGTFTARVCPMSSGYGEFVIDKKRRSIKLEYCTPVHRKDGYTYA